MCVCVCEGRAGYARTYGLGFRLRRSVLERAVFITPPRFRRSEYFFQNGNFATKPPSDFHSNQRRFPFARRSTLRADVSFLAFLRVMYRPTRIIIRIRLGRRTGRPRRANQSYTQSYVPRERFVFFVGRFRITRRCFVPIAKLRRNVRSYSIEMYKTCPRRVRLKKHHPFVYRRNRTVF